MLTRSDPGCAGAMPESPNILLVRLDGLGDALACVPALEGLRRAYSSARFGVVCSPANAALFSKRRVDRVYVYEGTKNETEAAVFAELRSARYTHALIATEEPIGYRIAHVSRAARRAGFWHRFEKTFKSVWQLMQVTDAVYRPAAWVREPEHEVAAIYRLAERFGATQPIPDDPAKLRVWIDVAEDAALRDGPKTLAFQVTPKLADHGWDPRALAAFALIVLDASPLRRIVFLASASDEGLARSIMEHMRRDDVASGRVMLAPPGPMRTWLAAIASAGALVTPDTGAAHAAGILGVPVVDLFDVDRFEQLSRQWRPWAAPSRCLVKPAYRPDLEASFGEQVSKALAEVAPARGARS
jgi:ADP-heptose:LPS heptosyltransferase